MAASKKGQLNFISFAYAIGTVLVIFGHSFPLGKAVIPESMLSLRAFVYSFHMPLFFYISGALLKYWSDERGLYRGMTYPVFILKKAKKLLIPYFVLALLAFVPKYLMTGYISDRVLLDADYLIRSFFVPRENVWGHFWFIPVLFGLFCFSYLQLKIVQKAWSTVLFTILFLLLNFHPINLGWLGIRDICNYGIYFWLGLITSDYITANQTAIFSRGKGIAALVTGIGLFLSLAFMITGRGAMLRSMLFLLVALLLIYSILCLGIVYQQEKYSFFEWLNGKIYTVFLLSWPCQSIIEICLNKILNLYWFIVMPSMFLSGLLGPLLIIWLYRKLKIENRLLKASIGIS